MRVLLTGSSGWLGRYLAPRLRAAGHQVVGLDVVTGAETHVLGSVADSALITRLFDDHAPEGVIHAAALHKPDIARYPAQAFVDVNVTGTLNLLEAAAARRVQHFVFTSTTSLMITEAIRAERQPEALWLDETSGPLAPRNIYGVTKRSAEELCRLVATERGLPVIVLRTGRFFPEDDDTHRALSGENMKANELLHRRLTVDDCARAHLVALDKAPPVGFGVFVVSAPTPFSKSEARALMEDAPGVIRRHFPDVEALYRSRSWQLPARIGRVYDAERAEAVLGFRCETDFTAVLSALREGRPLPFAHDPGYVSPKERGAAQPSVIS